MVNSAASNPYAVLGLEFGATAQEIKSAHKKLALKYHPDKNAGNEASARKFMEVQEAYQILTDEKAKEACDALLQVKKQREQRENEMDKKRKADIDRLNEREKAARQRTDDVVSAERRYESELARMRARNKELMEEAAEKRRAELERQTKLVQDTLNVDRAMMNQMAELSRTVRVKWTTKGALDSARLEALFIGIGEIDRAVAGKKSGLVVFKQAVSAANAMHAARQGSITGAATLGLTVEWVDANIPAPEPAVSASTSAATPGDLETADECSSERPPMAAGEEGVAQSRGEEEKSSSTNAADGAGASEGGDMPRFSSFKPLADGDVPEYAKHRDYESVTMMRMRQLAERQRLAAELDAQDA